MKFRKKPVEIEAFRFDGSSSSRNAIRDWVSGGPEPVEGGIRTSDIVDLYIETLEGTMRASAGDWIIKGVQGEFYPCKPDIFASTYEPVMESDFYEEDEPVEKIVAAFAAGQDLLHPDWTGDSPLYDFKEALSVARQYAATIPASEIGRRITLNDVLRVVKYEASYSGDKWKPGDYTGTELDLRVLFRLKDGRWGLLTGWNDYTGWGCQDGADLKVGEFGMLRATATADDRVWLDEVELS